MLSLKRFPILIVTLLACVPCTASTDIIDSLEVALSKAAPDTNKVWLYRDIAWEWVQDDPPLSIQYSDSAIWLSEDLGFKLGIAKGYYCRALGLDFNGETQESIRHFNIAKGHFTDLGSQEWIGNCINSIGVTHYYAGEFNEALEKYVEALEHWEKNQDKEHASQTLNNIGVIYRYQQKHEEALKIYDKSVVLKKELGDSLGLAHTYRNIGLANSYLDREEEALRYNFMAIAMYERLGEYRELTSGYGSVGTSYYKLEQFESAEEYLDLALAQTISDPKEIPAIQVIAAKVKNELGKYQEALQLCEKALSESGLSSAQAGIRDAFYEKAQALNALGRFEEAYAAMDSSYRHSLTMADRDRMKEMEKMQAQFDVKQRQQDLEISELKLADKERAETLFIGGLIAAGVGLLLALWLVLTKIRNNRKLSAKNLIIEKSLGEKEVLLREIHHRVKNNLQVISSLLSIQSREIEDAVALEAVNESRNRVKSMAIIHQNLYKEDNITGIDVGDYVEKLSQSLFHSYKVDQDTIRLKTDIDHLNLDVDTTIPLGLILNELITNALKYAFAGRDNGLLEVILKERDGALELIVTDDGVGINPDDPVRDDSFGMKMIQAFARKLEADWEVNGDQGTTVKLRIKKYKKAS